MALRMMFALSLGLAGVILATQIARAEPRCGPRDTVLGLLADRYGETRRSIGLAADATLMELHANTDTGTWTLTLTTADGTTCLVAAGQEFETLDTALPAGGKRV